MVARGPYVLLVIAVAWMLGLVWWGALFGWPSADVVMASLTTAFAILIGGVMWADLQ